MLLLRPGLALAFQALFALGYALAGADAPWRAGADWWLGSFALGECINLGLLVRLMRREGLRYRYLLGVDRAEWKRDALWGSAQVGADLAFRPLPIAGAWAIVLVFPFVHALTELPTYFGYVMPRLQALRRRRVGPALACSCSRPSTCSCRCSSTLASSSGAC